MRNRIERLRVWLLAGAGLLVLVLAAFLGYAHLRAHRFLAGLPGKLGAKIVRETNGYTYSQSVQGKTVYTIHAAKAVEHTDGKITLHDVSIELYGRRQETAGRPAGSDRISGSEFEYDQNAGIVRAVGLVHIDLQAPASAASADAHVLHATTSGLVYLQKLGVAATGEPVEFQLGPMTGHSVGADYNADTGVLVLHSEVSFSGVEGDRPVVLTASRALLDRRDNLATLEHARYQIVSSSEAVQAEHAVVHTRADGSPERIEAEGNVTMSAQGGVLTAQRGSATLNEASKPQTMHLAGGLFYSANETLRQARGTADSADLAFNPQGRPSHAEFLGAVHMTERLRASAAPKEPWTVRDLTAAKVEVALGNDALGHSQVHDADATGAAHLTVVDVAHGPAGAHPGEGRTELGADDLKAHLVRGTDGRTTLDTLTASGHTILRQLTANGVDQSSTGDLLEAKFRPSTPVKAAVPQAKPDRQVTEALQSAVQSGHVSLTRSAPAKTAPGTPPVADVQHATADRAAYDGDSDRLVLTGGVAIVDRQSALWANQVTLDHETGDALAQGNVKVSYEEAPAAPTANLASGPVKRSPDEPVHVLATSAELKHATEVSTFYGTAATPVRLWQAGSQITAPTIEFARKQKTMIAHGSGSDPAQFVHAVLVTSAAAKSIPPSAESAPATARKAPRDPTASSAPQVIRIVSRELTYLDSSRQAEFTGGVRVEGKDTTLHAQEASVYLHRAVPATLEPGALAPIVSLGGSVERIVAQGQVEIDQPGRQAAGDRLVYTASDELFVLTGEPGAPPRLVDSAHGTVTGASLRFHRGDNSVVVSGAVADTAAGATAPIRVRTTTRVKQ
jgi:lipopolysaccharide export system protein LptA